MPKSRLLVLQILMLHMVPAPASLAQWASSAIASSQYGSGGYSATQATGPSNVAPSCGDSHSAWAPESNGVDPEWLLVSFQTPTYATSIEIYETFQDGFVTLVEVVDMAGVDHAVFSGPDTTVCGGSLRIDLPGAILVAQVRIHTQVYGWEEIDAVQMTGRLPAASPSAPSAPSEPPWPPRHPVFAAVSGECVLDGNCIHSQGFPTADYGTSQSCTVSNLPAVAAQVVAFDVEPHGTCDYDHVTINGERFCGTTGPDGIVPADGLILWQSDAFVAHSGWKICFAALPLPPAQPPVPQLPPSSPPLPPHPPRPPAPPAPPLRPPALPPSLPLPVSFSFEDPLWQTAGWTTGSGGHAWTRHQGATPTQTTGPTAAHGGIYYMYTETSSPRGAGDKFDLGYACPRGDQVMVTWWYHMYGRDIGSLRLKTSTGAISWSRSSDQGDSWQSAAVLVSSDAFVFEAELGGSSFRGDLAIDDVEVTCLEASPPWPPSLPASPSTPPTLPAPPSPPSPPLWPPLAPPPMVRVTTPNELNAATTNYAIGRIVLAPGHYPLADTLNIQHSVTIEAEVRGAVVLDGQGARRVVYVLNGHAVASGIVLTIELIGVNITGGLSGSDTAGGGLSLFVHAPGVRVRLTHCSIYSNIATRGGGISVLGDHPGSSLTLHHCIIYGNSARDYGGGLYWLSTAHMSVVNVTFGINAAGRRADSLHAVDSPAQGSHLINVSFRDQRANKVAIDANYELPWRCSPGTWMPPTGRFSANFTGCLYKCPVGVFGSTDNLTTARCTGACPKGHWCGEATVTPTAW